VPAVRYYGHGVMDAINRRAIPREAIFAAMNQLPGYADGGPVARQLLAGLDSGARPNLLAIAGNPTLPAIQGDTINLVMPDGTTHAVRADRDTSKALQRDMRWLAIKSGKR